MSDYEKTNPTVLFHGSPKKIKGYLLPNRTRTPATVEGKAVEGVYATPNFNLAVAFSLRVIRTSLFETKAKHIHCNDKGVEVVLEHCRLAQRTGYVYTIPSKNFSSTDSSEYFSTKAARILETTKIPFAQIEAMVDEGIIQIKQEEAPSRMPFRWLFVVMDSILSAIVFIKKKVIRIFKSNHNDSL